MQQRYFGLTLGQVYENRERYGSNVVPPLTTEHWSTKLQRVCNYWMVKFFYFISLLTIFMLPLLDLCGVPMSNTIWSILIILPLLLIIIFIIVLLDGHYNIAKDRYEISFYNILLLFLLVVQTLVTYYESISLSLVLIKLYTNSMILASVIILIELIKLIIQSRRNRLLAQKQMLEDTKDVNVIRDGHTLKIHRKDIVVGDIICLHEGEIVPADAELLEANNLVVDESNIAGKKFCYKSLDPNLISQADTTSFSSHIISGSLIIHGEAVAQVYAVGQKTRVAVLSNNYQLQDKNKNIEHLSHSFT